MGFNKQGEMKKRKEFQDELTVLESIEEDSGLSSEQIERKTWLLVENLKNLE
jgi:hypothetical protein